MFCRTAHGTISLFSFPLFLPVPFICLCCLIRSKDFSSVLTQTLSGSDIVCPMSVYFYFTTFKIQYLTLQVTMAGSVKSFEITYIRLAYCKLFLYKASL